MFYRFILATELLEKLPVVSQDLKNIFENAHSKIKKS